MKNLKKSILTIRARWIMNTAKTLQQLRSLTQVSSKLNYSCLLIPLQTRFWTYRTSARLSKLTCSCCKNSKNYSESEERPKCPTLSPVSPKTKWNVVLGLKSFYELGLTLPWLCYWYDFEAKASRALNKIGQSKSWYSLLVHVKIEITMKKFN